MWSKKNGCNLMSFYLQQPKRFYQFPKQGNHIRHTYCMNIPECFIEPVHETTMVNAPVLTLLSQTTEIIQELKWPGRIKCTRAATIHSPHDTIRIVILASRYDTYRDTLFRLEIISNRLRILLWCSPYLKVCLKWFILYICKSLIMWKVYSINFSSVNRS